MFHDHLINYKCKKSSSRIKRAIHLTERVSRTNLPPNRNVNITALSLYLIDRDISDYIIHPVLAMPEGKCIKFIYSGYKSCIASRTISSIGLCFTTTFLSHFPGYLLASISQYPRFGFVATKST